MTRFPARLSASRTVPVLAALSLTGPAARQPKAPGAMTVS
jgi:hypothetical protein